MFRFILSVIVVFIGILCLPAKSDDFPECFNQTIGTFLPVKEDCTKAIYCNGLDSSIVECDEHNPYFSALDKKCYDDIKVCDERFPHVNQSTTLKEEKETTISFRPTTPRPTSSVVVFATESTTTTSTTSTISTTTPSIANISCPLEDNPQRPLYLPHPKSCSQYYLCYHGFPIVMQCPNLLLFDVIQQSCNAAELVNCQLNSVSEPPRHCLPHMVMVYPHPKVCNYYYRCEFGYLKVMQCPFGMGWDYEMAICTQLEKTKCYKSVNGYFN